MELLDNPLWNALAGEQAAMSVSGGLARRFRTDVGPLSGVAEETPECFAALHPLLGDDMLGLFLRSEFTETDGFRILVQKPLVQMVCHGWRHELTAQERALLLPLGESDVPEMIALAKLTQPGPFRTRTIDFGGYVGIRQGGRLAAMGGYRTAVPGMREISAVCVHPDFQGRGWGRLMTIAVTSSLAEQGIVPYLHAWQHNANAIALYEKLGYELRKVFSCVVLASAETAGVPSGFTFGQK